MIETVSLAQSGDLDRFVRSHPNGHFMQTSAWGRFKSDWKWRGLLCRSESGELLGTMSLLLHQIRGTHLHLLYAPRGPVFDHNDLDTFRALVEGARVLASKCGGYLLRMDPQIPASDQAFRQVAEALHIRIDPISDFSSFQPRLVYQTDLAGRTEESLMQAFHSTTRYNIRLAQRKGVEIRQGSPEDAGIFAEIMACTARRDGFTAHSAAFYQNLLLSFGQDARMYLAWYEGRPVAGSICIHIGHQTWDVFHCSNGAEHAKPNELLKWAMLRWALSNGSDLYDFRGVEGYPREGNPKIGLHRFKQGFDSHFVEYMGQMDLAIRPATAWCVSHLQQLLMRIRT